MSSYSSWRRSPRLAARFAGGADSCLRLSEIRRLAVSIPITFTCSVSPTLSTSSVRSTWSHDSSEMCSKPSIPTKKYGAFLQIMVGIEGLLHISELSWDHVERTEDVLKVGETLQVKVIGIDTARRRISLSLKQLSAPPASLGASRSERRTDEYEDMGDES